MTKRSRNGPCGSRSSLNRADGACHLSIPKRWRVGRQSDSTGSPGWSERFALRQDRRQADDAPGHCVCAAKKALHERLVANLTLARANHMTFIEDDQSHIIDKSGIIAQCKIELLRRCDDDLARTKGIFVPG
jgi:hypothetical protein